MVLVDPVHSGRLVLHELCQRQKDQHFSIVTVETDFLKQPFFSNTRPSSQDLASVALSVKVQGRPTTLAKDVETVKQHLSELPGDIEIIGCSPGALPLALALPQALVPRHTGGSGVGRSSSSRFGCHKCKCRTDRTAAIQIRDARGTAGEGHELRVPKTSPGCCGGRVMGRRRVREAGKESKW